MTDQPFGLPPAWRAVTDRLCHMMDTGNASETLAEGPCSSLGIERYARAVVNANAQSDLGIMYALASVATCTAGQGAFVLHVPKAGGGWLEVPLIQYVIGVAPSGWRKSTALNTVRHPLGKSLDKGLEIRRVGLKLARRDAEAHADFDGKVKMDQKVATDQFMEVFNSGLCPETLVKDPTPEALRNMLVLQGGAIGVFAGEGDVFSNMGGKYNAPGDAGTFSFILDGWEQDDVSTARVKQGMLQMPEAAVFMAVLLQTGVFAEVTAGGGIGDSFQERGMFARFLVVETENTGGWAELAEAYADDVVFDTHEGPDGMADANGKMTPLGEALADYSQALDSLALEAVPYRQAKALRRGWLAALAKYGADLQVPEQHQEPRTVIKLDDQAVQVYKKIQRMYMALAEHLATSDPDTQTLWEPLVSRFVQHVLREAFAISMAAGRRYITAEVLTDAALRVFPWRWALSARALTKRNNERLENLIAVQFQGNPNQTDLSPEAKVKGMIVKMAIDNPGQARDGFPGSEIVVRCRSTISPKSARKGVGPRFMDALDKLALDPASGVLRTQDGINAHTKQPTWRYFIDQQQHAAPPR